MIKTGQRGRIAARNACWALPYLVPFMLLGAPTASAASCSADTLEQLRSPAEAATRPIEIDCDLTLQKNSVITVPIAFSGSRASGATLDCNGATLDGTKPKARTIVIRSVQRKDGSWDTPRDIHIRNCTIKGDIRIEGLGHNGEAEKVRESSLTPGHTQRAQSIAPSDIVLSQNRFIANVGTPVYLAPGVTNVIVENSRFTGKTVSAVIYLDAESARNRVIGNTFETSASQREIIAIDGSAENLIEKNTFVNPVKGGVFLYRNCGEGGTIRHQAPQRNVISDNSFRYKDWLAMPAVWLGSRQGVRKYCMTRPTASFGSGASPLDYAQNNRVTGNRLSGGVATFVLNSDANNVVSDNR